MWRRPVPAEQEALDRPWRVWASIVIGSFTAVSIVLGFLVVPWSEASEFDAFAVICRAIGIPGYQGEAREGEPQSAAAASQLSWTADVRDVIGGGDPAAATQLVAENCAACHGEGGVSIDPTMPNLAGQPAHALYKQLQDYRSGARVNEVMTPIAQALEEKHVADVSAFYAAQPRIEGAGAVSAVDPDILHLVRVGDPARAIPACNSCHEVGEGPVGTPNLIRQRPDYLQSQLQAFAEGTRSNDHFQRMRTIARVLTEAEMQRLADYYSGQPAR